MLSPVLSNPVCIYKLLGLCDAQVWDALAVHVMHIAVMKAVSQLGCAQLGPKSDAIHVRSIATRSSSALGRVCTSSEMTSFSLSGRL